MDNPFEPRKPRSPKAGRLLALDAWIDSSLYDAGFRAGERNGHHLQNRAAGAATVLVVGARATTRTGASIPTST